jgi:hypothetical protein
MEPHNWNNYYPDFSFCLTPCDAGPVDCDEFCEGFEDVVEAFPPVGWKIFNMDG